jgi:cysteine-rich repeat protein
VRTSLLLVAALLGGCTTNNPFFEVVPESGASTGVIADTSTSVTDAGGSEGTSGGADATTGEPVDPDTGEATDPGGSSTGPATGVTTGDATTGEASSTGAIDGTSGADTGTGDGESSSTGGGPSCGDGEVDGDEQCDDGNDVPADGCENNCRFMFAEVEHSLADLPHDLVFTDLDGDDVLDVLVAHANPQQGGPDLSIGLGKQDGTFDWDTIDAPGLLGASAVLVGRYVGDPKPDIVAMPANGASSLALWQNDSVPGEPMLSGPSTITGPPNTTYVAARTGDVNLDQKDDLLFVSAAMNKLYLHRNNGAGFSPALSWATAAAPVDLAVGPLLVGDALPDVLVAYKGGVDDVGGFKGDGKGSFAAGPAFDHCSDGAIGLGAGDADQAGALDVVITCETGGVLVLAGQDGVKSYERTLGPGLPAVVHAGIVDLYGDDTDADVFAVAGASKELLIGVQAAKQFLPSFSVPLKYTPRRLVVGDVNDDGAPDLMLVYPGAARVSVFLNQTRMDPPPSQ